MSKQTLNEFLSLRPGQPKRGRRGEDALDTSQQTQSSHRRDGTAQWRPSRSDEADSGDYHDEEGRDSSPQAHAAKRRRVHAPEHVPQDSSSDDQPGTTSRPANAVCRPGGFGRNKPKAPLDDFFSLSGQQSNDFDDEDEDDEADEGEDPSSPDSPQRVPGRRGRPPGSKNKKPPRAKVVGPPKRAGRPPGSKNKKPKIDRTLPTSSVTLVPSGPTELHESHSDSDHNAQGEPLPTPLAQPKGNSRKTAGLDRAGSPLLFQIGTDNSVDIGRLMVNQPCCRNIQEIGDRMQSMATFTEDDNLVLEKALVNNSNLPKLFQILWVGFRCRLYDLFKFGLWFDVTLPGEVGRANTVRVGKGSDAFTVVPPYPARDFTKNLMHLAAHPIWGGDVDRLRYVLMYAVSCRVEGHDAPILPILPLDGQLLDRFEASPGDMALLRYKVSQEHGIASHGDIRLLCDEMDRSATISPPRDDMARSLFLLKTTDVVFVIRALDRLQAVMTKHKLYQPTEWYYEEWDKQKLNQWPRQKPKDVKAVPQHLQDSVLRWRAEHCIRQALKKTGGGYLYDVCEAHCSLTAKCLDDINAGEAGGPTQSQLDVIRGLVRPRNGLHLESDAWRVPDNDYTPAITNVRKKTDHTGMARSNASASAAPTGPTHRVAVSSGDGAVRSTEMADYPRLDAQRSNIFDDSDDYDIENASQRSGTLA